MYTGRTGVCSAAGRGDLRQDGRQGEELGRQVGQVDQEEDEERLDDANLLGEASDKAEDDGEHQTHQSPPNADDEEGGWIGGGRWVNEDSGVILFPCEDSPTPLK